MTQKRTLDSFFIAPSNHNKKARLSTTNDSNTQSSSISTIDAASLPASTHTTYPFAVAQLPEDVVSALSYAPQKNQRIINDKPDLDLLYYAPFIPSAIQRPLFTFLRSSLFYYRVIYNIKRGSVETTINTPRWTTVFGVDATSYFGLDTDQTLHDTDTKKPIPSNTYARTPRPLPACLETLKTITEAVTGEAFNFCLVNYYANGGDSISYHSDDERFLGIDPTIASLSLGARRDFLMKHKPVALSNSMPKSEMEKYKEAEKPMKFPLASGDMVLMRGKTQANWLHSIPKRKGPEAEGGRINITFRKAMVKGGTENYYRYNVGGGLPHKWDEQHQEMRPYVQTSS